MPIGGMDKDMMQAMLTLLVNKARSDGKIKKEREHRENTMDSMNRKGMMAGALGQVAGLGAQAYGMFGGGGMMGQDPAQPPQDGSMSQPRWDPYNPGKTYT